MDADADSDTDTDTDLDTDSDTEPSEWPQYRQRGYRRPENRPTVLTGISFNA